MATDIFRTRQQTIQIVFFSAAMLLIGRAAQLQLFSSQYRLQADATTIDQETIYPSRGQIFDRKGNLLVNNEAMYDLMVTYNQVKPDMDTARFCELTGITRADFLENMNKNWASGRFSKAVPFVFLKKISQQTYARFQEYMHEFPGFFAQLRIIRGYPYHSGGHVLGYINEVNDRDIERGKPFYSPGDYIGAGGLEAAYEVELRGKKGSKYLLRDNMGRTVGPYKGGVFDTLAVSGADMISSIDGALQSYGEKLMQGKTGSIVAIEPRTGEILAMVSAPFYDPNLLTLTADRGPVFDAMMHDPLKPFFDRTVMAKYPPGSIFKTLVGLTGMQTGKLPPNRSFTCAGGYYYGGRMYKCTHAHGFVGNMVEAVMHSCNGYFFSGFRQIIDGYEYTQPEIGLDTLNKYLHQFGLGEQLGIDYPNENAGNIATSAYYDKIYPKRLGGWRSPTVMSIGIGQGEEQLTTLQMANIACAIANKGYWYPPHLAKQFKDSKTLIPLRFRTKRKIDIDPQYFQIIIDGMAECVNRGTATIARIPDIQVCGKTGTSQNPHGDDHSVFVAFAPKENPKIAIAVFVENAGFGATYAAPIASLMIEKYLNGAIKPDRIAIEEKMVKANLVDKYLAEAYGNKKPRPGNEENAEPQPVTPPGDSLPPITIVPKEGN